MSEYTDKKNNRYPVTQRTRNAEDGTEQAPEEIVEALYAILAPQA